MDRQTAMRKVLRCLRMAGSSNPNEAAAALRQARALMDQHGLTEADAFASEISHSDAPTRSRGAMIPRSISVLANAVANGFRCDIIVQSDWRRTTIRFYGGGADAQVACYAFCVLRRQLEQDRARHTARIRKRANKAARGEQFALGFAIAVRSQFPSIDLADERAAAIGAAIAADAPDRKLVNAREIAPQVAKQWRDRFAGFVAGSAARVNPGLHESAQRRLSVGDKAP